MTPHVLDDTARPVLELRTSRLRLVALSNDLARLQADDPDEFFTVLNAQREASWPPPLFDAQQIKAQASAEDLGWRQWVALLELSPGAPVRVVGVCGFQGAPEADTGEAELVYAMFPSFQEQGLATEMVTGLLDWAFEDSRLHSVRADTPPYLISAQRVLEKTGFDAVGEHQRAGETVMRYRKSRA